MSLESRSDSVVRRTVPPGADPLWSELELPPPAPAPPGFAGRILARARAEERSRLGLPFSPAWSRAAAALALVVGIAGGAGLGWIASQPESETESLDWSATTTLAEEFVDLAATLDVEAAGGAGEAR